MLKNVVLPAPFGPIRLTIPPSGTMKSTSLTATRPPNSFRTAAAVSRSRAGIVERLVMDSLVELGRASRARDQPFGPEQHHDQQDDAEDAELVLRHLEARPERVVDRVADLREAGRVQPFEERAAEEHAPDVAHPAEDHHAEDLDGDVEEEVAGEGRALVRRVVGAGDAAEERARRVRP